MPQKCRKNVTKMSRKISQKCHEFNQKMPRKMPQI